MTRGFYLYAIGRADHPLPEQVEAIDGSAHLEVVVEGELAGFVTPVDLAEFSQEQIDARSKDVDWLGAIGYRHQDVMAALMRGGTIVPLRAFTLFGGDQAIRAQLREQRETFVRVLERLDGKQEWTLRIEFEPKRWSEALGRRVDSLRDLVAQIESAGAGKAFLLRKKLDDERKRASREAELQVVDEIEQAVLAKLACDTVAESRQQRDGAFPQLNVLLDRDEESRLLELRDELTARYEQDGVTLALTGPWPPYTFAQLLESEP